MIAIPESVVKRVPYIGPVVSSVGLALDVKEIVENSTPIVRQKLLLAVLLKSAPHLNYLLQANASCYAVDFLHLSLHVVTHWS